MLAITLTPGHLSSNTVMAGSRTIKTLTALLVSMTIGSFLLMLLESTPNPTPNPIAAAVPVADPGDNATRLIRDTKVTLRNNWHSIVLHSSACEGSDIMRRCHFFVQADGTVIRTDLWARQLEGSHVYVPGSDMNSDSIGIVVDLDASGKMPAAQAQALQNLQAALQKVLAIPNEHIYAHGALCGSTNPTCGVFN